MTSSFRAAGSHVAGSAVRRTASGGRETDADTQSWLRRLELVSDEPAAEVDLTQDPASTTVRPRRDRPQGEGMPPQQPLPPARPPAQTAVREPREPREPDPWQSVSARRSAIAKRWLTILVVACVIAALTFLVSGFLPGTYSATATVRVTTGSGSLSSRDAVTASNELAAQFSQLVTTSVVTEQAAEQTGEPVSTIPARVSSTVLSNQNIILVTAKASSPERATRLSVAMAGVLTDVARKSLTDTITPVLKKQIASLDRSILEAQQEQGRIQRAATDATAGSARQGVKQAELNGIIQRVAQLQFRKLQLEQDTTIRGAEYAVALTELGPAGAPKKESPRPGLYALIAFAASCVVGAQAAATAASRRRDG